MKVDSHIHLWDERHTPQLWMSADDTAIARPFGPSDIMPLLERNGVDAVTLYREPASTPTPITWSMRRRETTGSEL